MLNIARQCVRSLPLLLCLCANMMWAQGGQTGAISGVVKDTQGAVIQGATVEIVNAATGVSERKINTDAAGNFSASLLQPGSYQVTISHAGFKQYRTTLTVRLDETTKESAVLEVGSIGEVIEVTGSPTLVNTESPTTGQVIEAHTLGALPLAVPNFTFLLTLSPGTAGEPADVRSAGRGTVDINVNGQRTSNNSVSIEGISVNDFNLAHFDTIPLPNPHTIQEFKVATSLYDASLGSKGGAAINLILKTGSKALHWEAYGGHRDDYFNANEWFFKRTKTKRGRLLQNVVGFSGSGPAWGIGGFWFANVQGLRGRNGIDPNGSQIRPIIPALPAYNPDGTTSAAMLASQFKVPVANIDPVAVNILNLKSSFYGGTFLVPRPGQASCGAVKPFAPDPKKPNLISPGVFDCTVSKVTPLDDNQYTITYQRPLRSDHDTITGRWFYDNGKATRPLGAGGTLAEPTSGVQDNRLVSITISLRLVPTS